MKYDILNGLELTGLEKPFVSVEVRRELDPAQLDVPCYVLEMWAAPKGEELAPKLLYLETPFSPFIWDLTKSLFDGLREKEVEFEFKNETELEL